jgi:hypothetical protein
MHARGAPPPAHTCAGDEVEQGAEGGACCPVILAERALPVLEVRGQHRRLLQHAVQGVQRAHLPV